MVFAPTPGELVDAAPFAQIVYWTGSSPETLQTHRLEACVTEEGKWWKPVSVPEQGGPHIGLEWEEPRRFCKVIIVWASKAQIPNSAKIKLQYWHRSWPQIGLSGWNAIDDFYNGHWVNAAASVTTRGARTTFSILPLTTDELNKEGIEPVNYRVALRLRLLFTDNLTAPIKSIKVLGDYAWKKIPIRIEFVGQTIPCCGRLEVHNGYLTSESDWKLTNNNWLEASVLAADVSLDSPDRTICTVRTECFNFSFLPLEAAASPIFIKDFGVFISSGEKFAGWVPKTKCVFDRVADEPEQSYEQASRKIPALRKTLQTPRPRYVPLGVDGNRQEIAIMYNGDILIERSSLKSKPTDREPLLWPEKEDHLLYHVMTGSTIDCHDGEDDTRQWILDGYLPVVFSEWQTEGIRYRMQSFAALLGEPTDKSEQRGDEPTLLLNKILITNTQNKPSVAHLWIAMQHPEKLVMTDNCVMAIADLENGEVYQRPRLRFCFGGGNRGQGLITSTEKYPSLFSYEIALDPGESHEVNLRVPFVTFEGSGYQNNIMSLDFDVKLQETVEYWKSLINSGAQIVTPERLINDFARFQLAHIAITADPDPLTGLTMLPAATYSYGVCANESVHQIRSLDLRGYHDRAEKYLEPFIKLQGTRNLHGLFKNPDGAFHGLRISEDTDYQTFNYNLDHGFVLWMICEHYKLTRNKDWASRVADNMVKACDFIIRERQASKRTDGDNKVWEYGLLPPGHLEDPPEFHYWYAVNAYAARGMKQAGEVLKEIGHSEAERISKEAESYLEDLRRAARESMTRAPVVRLRDGTSVPFQPTRCLLRGRDWGWIRDALYGPIHLLDCGIYDPKSSEATWILKDAEDNVFISELYGRRLDDFEQEWFSHGGITIQSNLLPNPLVYLKRGQPEHAIRAFYNSMAANLYPDVRVFCEHPVEAYGRGAGPFFKAPDESAFITWLRHLLIMEDDDVLKIMPGAPRAWFGAGKQIKCLDMPTYFGPVSFSTFSEGDTVLVEIQPPKRNPPETIELHVRQPMKKPISRVTVDGKPYSDFDAATGIVRFRKPSELSERLQVIIRF